MGAVFLSSRSVWPAGGCRQSEIRPWGVDTAKTPDQILGADADRESLVQQSAVLGIAGTDAERRIASSGITRSMIGGGVVGDHQVLVFLIFCEVLE